MLENLVDEPGSVPAKDAGKFVGERRRLLPISASPGKSRNRAQRTQKKRRSKSLAERREDKNEDRLHSRQGHERARDRVSTHRAFTFVVLYGIDSFVSLCLLCLFPAISHFRPRPRRGKARPTGTGSYPRFRPGFSPQPTVSAAGSRLLSTKSRLHASLAFLSDSN